MDFYATGVTLAWAVFVIRQPSFAGPPITWRRGKSLSSFKDQNWGKRFEKLGDEAEGHFETWCSRSRLGFVRFGLDRPPIKVGSLPARLRYAPDYLLTSGFVEVQGVGRDQLVKVKLEKYGCLRWWDDLHHVELYLWDSANERETFLTLEQLDGVIASQATTLGVFDGRKAYFSLPASVCFDVGNA